MIYLDNAATTLIKPKETMLCLKKSMELGNPGRGGHPLSVKAARALYQVRMEAATFFEADSPENICFFYNTTAAINTVIKILGEKGGSVVISNMEHNAVRRPVLALEKKGVKIKMFEGVGREEEILHSFENALGTDTFLAVFIHTSNVCSVTLPIEKLCAIARKKGIMTLVDCAQSGGVLPISMKRIGADGLSFPGHKGLFGIMGAGMLVTDQILKKRLEESPTLMEGGGGISSVDREMPEFLPERLESGTVGLPAIMALGGGLSFLRKVTVEEVERKHRILEKRLLEGLYSIKNVEVHGATAGAGPLLFTKRNRDHSELGEALSRENFCLRDGLHCAPLAHKRLGTLESGGGLRVSVSYFTKMQEIDRFLYALSHV